MNLRCPGCRQTFALANPQAGTQAICPSCGRALRLPGVSTSGAPDTAPSTVRPDASAPAPPRPAVLPFDFLSPPRAPDEIGRLGDYRVLRVLGIGGMGVVFLAEDPALRRRIALKVMKPEAARAPGAGERFLREARAIAAITHDHVIPVYHVGEAESPVGRVPFLTMPYLQGEPLDARLERRRPLPAAEAVCIGRQIAEGLAAAHAAGLVHRDVKPGNVWLEAPGGRVKLLDFGLAFVAGDDRLTQRGALLGTPAYMAPEQAARSDTVDHRADLFSLGCILYEMATGQRPFRGPDLMALLSALANHEPPAPDALAPGLPAGLSPLVMNLLAKRPQDRPASAREVAAALAALEVRPEPSPTATASYHPLAPPPSTMVLPPRRRWPLAAAAGLLVVAVVAGALWAIRKGDSAPTPGPAPGPEGGGQPPVVAAGPQTTMGSGLPNLTLKGHAGRVRCVAFRPDGKQVASGGDDGTVRVWDAATGQRGRILKGHIDAVNALAYSRDGKRLATGGADRALKIWDADTGTLIKPLVGHKAAVRGLAFNPDGTRLAAGDDDRVVKVWDVAGEKVERTLAGHRHGLNAVDWSPDGRRIASAAGDRVAVRGEVKLWDATEGKEMPLAEGGACSGNSVCFSPDGKRLAATGLNQTLKIWDLASGDELRNLKGHADRVTFVCGGTRLAAASRGWKEETAEIGVWDVTGGQLERGFRGHSGEIHGLACSPDGKRLASAGADGTVRLWDTAAGQTLHEFRLAVSPLGPLVFSHDGRRLAACGGGREIPATVIVCDGSTGNVVTTLKGHGGNVLDVAFTPDGKRLVTAGADRSARVWVAETGLEETTFKIDMAEEAVVSPDAGLVSTFGRTARGARVWKVPSEKMVLHLDRPNTVYRVAFSPDGRHLATASNGKVRIWDKESPDKEERILDGHGTVALTLVYGPDGSHLACGWYATAKVWKAGSDDVLYALTDSRNAIGGRWAFSPDGRRAARLVGGNDVMVWDLAAGWEALRLVHAGPVHAIAFSPDGKRLAGIAGDGTVRVWDMDAGRDLRTVVEGGP